MIAIVSHSISSVQKMILEQLLDDKQLQGQVIDLDYQKLESLDLNQANCLIGIGTEAVPVILTLTEGRPRLVVKLIQGPLPRLVGQTYNLDLLLESKPPRLELLAALDSCHPIIEEMDDNPLCLKVKDGKMYSDLSYGEIEQLVVGQCRRQGFYRFHLQDLPAVVYESKAPDIKNVKLEFTLPQFLSFLKLSQDEEITLLAVKDRLGARHRLT